MPLSREKLESFKASESTTVVRIRSLGDTVCLRSMTAAQRDALEASAKQSTDGFLAALCAASLCGDDGKLMYDDITVGIERLQEMPCAVISEIAGEVLKFNGMEASQGNE